MRELTSYWFEVLREITSYWFDVQKRANFKQLFCATSRFSHSYLRGCQTTRTTRTETSRPVSEDKSARKRGLVGQYVKTIRTVLLIFNCK